MENPKPQTPESERRPDAPETPAPKGWDSALYGMPDGEKPRRPGDADMPTVFGTGRSYIWQGVMIYFLLWAYGILLALNALPVLNGSVLDEPDMALMLRYLPGITTLFKGLGWFLVVLGAMFVICRFMLARFKRYALPVFFTVCAVDLIVPLMLPVMLYMAMQPLSSFLSLGDVYKVFLQTPDSHRYFLYPAVGRLILLAVNAWYYWLRRADFRN